MTFERAPRRTRSVAICLCIVVCFVIAGINEVNHRPKTPLAVPATAGRQIPRERWDDLANWVTNLGETVEPYNPADPNTLRIRISEKEVPNMTEAKAKDIAEGGLDTLGEGGAVYVLSPSGRLIGMSHR